MKNKIYLGLLFAVLLVLNVSAKEAFAQHLVQIVLDDTGALQDSEDPQGTATARESMLRYLSGLGDNYGRNTDVIIVSQFGAKNIWSGQAREIKRSSRNQGLQKFLTSNWGGCSDLIKVTEILEENIFLNQADSYEIVFFSSLLHTGCPGGELSLELPEEFFSRLNHLHENTGTSFKFYWVFDDSRSKIRSQIVSFIRENNLPPQIRAEAETRSGNF